MQLIETDTPEILHWLAVLQVKLLTRLAKTLGRSNKTINSGRIAASPVEWHLTGGAQPLAITMNEGVCLAVEVDPQHIQRRLETGYCDEMASTLDEALHQVREACGLGQPLSIGLIGNAAEVYPELVRRGIIPDMVTDQTSAHDALNGYIPAGMSLDEAGELRALDPQAYIERSMDSMVTHVRAMLEMQARARLSSTTATTCAARRWRLARRTRWISQVSSRPTFARCSVAARDPSAGWRSQAIRRISTAQTRPSSNCFPKMPLWRAGSRWPGRRFTSRVCPRASAGLATGSAIRPGWPSTNWLPGGSSRLPL